MVGFEVLIYLQHVLKKQSEMATMIRGHADRVSKRYGTQRLAIVPERTFT